MCLVATSQIKVLSHGDYRVKFCEITDEIQKNVQMFQLMLKDEHLLMTISDIAEVSAKSLMSGCKILLIGNGGSAADSQHIAAVFVNKFKIKRNGLAALALTTDTSVLTSIANDFGYRNIFSRQIQSLGKEGDILYAYSTSGTSENVLAGIDMARSMGLTTVGLTGNNESDMRSICDYVVNIPSCETTKIQEGHLAVGHILSGLGEKLVN